MEEKIEILENGSHRKRVLQSLKETIGKVIVGQEQVIDQVLWGLIGGGHVLLEGPPGLGKTLLVKTIARCLNLQFSRIQFTPDLMPSDVLGTHVLLSTTEGNRQFSFLKGPIFGQIILADEINRATPKTQSALLEVMQEHACTIGSQRYFMEEPFFVLATENPIEMEGTYPLPEAQLDRFFLKVLVLPPSESEMMEILSRTTSERKDDIQHVIEQSEVLAMMKSCRQVIAAAPILRYASRLVRSSDPQDSTASDFIRANVRFGAGVRGAQSLILAAKATSLLDGRSHVSIKDIQLCAKPVLRHRILRSFEAESEGISSDQLVDHLFEIVPADDSLVEESKS